MEFIDVNAIGPKIIAVWVLIFALGWYTHDQTKRFFFATLLTLGLLFLSARLGGVITEHHVEKFTTATGGKLDPSTHRAKMIGNQRHRTSAGQGGGTSKHYRKHIEAPDMEQEY